MERTHNMMINQLQALIEGSEEYYGYTMTKEQAAELYQTACLDAECEQVVDVSEVTTGDVLYVSEDGDKEMHTIQIR